MSSADIVALIVAGFAFVTSLIAVRTSFILFTTEKRWEQKAGAYTRIIEALSEMIDYCKQIEDHELEIRKLTDEQQQEINDRWKQARREISKTTNMGAFLVSAEAEASLQHLSKALEDYSNLNTVFEMVDKDYAVVQECLKQLIAYAKKDLRVK